MYKWYNDLFKLSPKLQQKYDKLFKKAKPNDNTFLICAQIRMGNVTQNNIKDDTVYTHKNESFKFWDLINREFVTKISDKNYRLFVTSDLDGIRLQAEQVFGKDSVVFNEDKPSHLDKDFNNMGENCEHIESTLIDFHMLRNCDACVASHSGYGILGCWNRPIPNRNFYVFTKPNQTDLMRNYGDRTNLVFKKINDLENDLYFT